MSSPTWQSLCTGLGSEIHRLTNAEGVRLSFVIPFGSLLVVASAIVLTMLVIGGLFLPHSVGAETTENSTQPNEDRLPGRFVVWGVKLGRSLSLLMLWQLAWTIGLLTGWRSLQAMAEATASLTLALSFAVAMWAWWSLRPATLPNSAEMPREHGAYGWRSLLAVMLVYSVVFVGMNWSLWSNLRIPHGDSAMYEEHLWNLTHGKGFRSYLDQGLFLGEHIQVVHLGLLPLYVVWPSHLLLELCETLALASGSLVVFQLCRTLGSSRQSGFWLGVAYLLYFPMQFLDIEIDLKTFRPEAFGIPLLLLTLWRMELWRTRKASLWQFVACIVATLTVKEDYSLIFGPLGLWLVWMEWTRARFKTTNVPGHSRGRLADIASAVRGPRGVTGCLLMVVSVAYLLFAVKVAIPYFRGGEGVHYARYYAEFGSSFTEIAWNMATRPDRVVGRLANLSTTLFALSLLVPCAFLSLGSPSRLMVGLPLFCLLSLNNIAQDPRHHFHAPLVAIVFWSAAAGIVALPGIIESWSRAFMARWPGLSSFAPRYGARCWQPESLAFFGAATALQTGIWFSLSPVGVTFWDPHSNWSWTQLYAPTERASAFQKIADLIPPAAKVASTDYIHPRYTHHLRSYDYSKYPRKVSGYELRVPEDTDYIVFDAKGPYSEIDAARQIPEYANHPEKWELLPDTTSEYFIVLKRRWGNPATIEP